MLGLIALKQLCLQRRSLSDRLPRVTMRHQARVHALADLDVQIIAICKQAGITEAEAYRMAIGGNTPSCM